ncbi:kinase-like protein [Neolentinus lepideus HHB14362 ss-1]|uniref:Kinase-like protein n=1 Tax=Neolentinus lepideus HHB14362 ss-1 TaxID=1314782 RepID=A0A165RFD7_9AGAM|nr:kinase-like protein [Neolentinus lepideus HHB14362 ss-1]
MDSQVTPAISTDIPLPWCRPLSENPQEDISLVSEGDHHIWVEKNVRRIGDSRNHLDSAIKEVADIWCRIDHPRVAPLICIPAYLGPHHFPLVLRTPYYPRGDIVTYLKINPESDVIVLIAGVTEGLQFLHAHEIIHGGIRRSNVFVGKDGFAVLTDVGIALATGAHDVRSLAPEVLLYEGEDRRAAFTTASDVYALGMLLFEIITHERPFARRTVPQIICQIAADGRPSKPEVLSPVGEQLWPLIEMCWSADPAERPSMDEVSAYVRSLE